MQSQLNGWQATLLVFLIWAAVYLPALGSLEIKGEEGRRILPAIAMLETGNFIVPHVGSTAYFNKPPLVNWLVAGSFKLVGVRNELAARLPSALAVLVAALTFIAIARHSLGANGSLVAALAWLTNFGLIEKGRLIEIEALYVSLTALAFVCWFAFWRDERSPWLTWIAPWVFLGLGWLAKGPLHLIFFYACVVGVLYQRRELRQLLHPAHLLGITVMLAIFAAWAVPCLLVMHGSNITQAWSRQFSGRLAGEGFKFAGWIQNIPRGLAYLLPWLLLLLATNHVEFVDENERRTVRGLSWGIALSFLAVSLLPGSLPRYTMPLLGPACCLLSMLWCAERLDLPTYLQLHRPAFLPAPLRLPITLAFVVSVAMCGYAFAVVPQLRHREKVRTIATEIEAKMPAGETLFAIDPDYQPFLFYMHRPVVYESNAAELPANAHYAVVQPEGAAGLLAARPSAEELLRVKDYRGRTVILFSLR